MRKKGIHVTCLPLVEHALAQKRSHDNETRGSFKMFPESLYF